MAAERQLVPSEKQRQVAEALAPHTIGFFSQDTLAHIFVLLARHDPEFYADTLLTLTQYLENPKKRKRDALNQMEGADGEGKPAMSVQGKPGAEIVSQRAAEILARLDENLAPKTINVVKVLLGKYAEDPTARGAAQSAYTLARRIESILQGNRSPDDEIDLTSKKDWSDAETNEPTPKKKKVKA